ncbi:MAG: cytochrome oxidase subunit III [Acidobacteria bacterium]|nr:MAG: cytochrome oxidase subunit III [Acidobacteriota bacterium]
MNEVAISTHDSVMEERPFAMPSSKLVMWLFIISDAITFGALLFAYGYLRNATPNWPTPFKPASIVNVMIMTFILITSSLTILLGVRAASRDDKSGAIRWTLITAGGGVLFALLHVREWLELIHEGVRLYQNPWGSGLFGASFFSITGLHLTHVVAGVIALIVLSIGYNRGRYTAHHMETWSLYWHFVDLVWMFVVPLVYLMNISR